MAKDSKIEWCDHTFNGWIGCTKVSPACDNCYAAVSTPARTMGIEWGAGKPRHRTSAANWMQPLLWDKLAKSAGVRHKVFCSSLADVFDNEVDPQWRADLFELIDKTPNLDWLLLTKRIGNAAKMIPKALNICFSADWRYPLENVWIGATICNQEEADRDIPKLLNVPGVKRFLSVEPLLGEIDLVKADAVWAHRDGSIINQVEAGPSYCKDGSNPDPLIDWVICGGESGHKARPMHPDWARSLRDQCVAAGVPFFFKQWGEWEVANAENGHHESNMTRSNAKWVYPNNQEGAIFSKDAYAMVKVGKKAAGRLLDGIEHNGVPA